MAYSNNLSRGLQMLSVKGQIVHVFSFVGNTVSVAVKQLCQGSRKADRDVITECVPIKLYLQKTD